jgi:hypothetical protein
MQSRTTRIQSLAKSLDKLALTDGIPAEAAVSLMKAANSLGNVRNHKTDNDMVNETARRGMLAEADAEDRLADECDRRADEAQSAMLSANDRAIVDHYSRKIRDHRAQAEIHRARAASHRNAAAAL